jgi:Zn finger protein HypA/HybF involved in hydrogenase expression
MNTKYFIEKAKKTHGNKYDYSKVKYFNSQTKIEVICPTHGSFMMKANSHANGQGCSVCGRIEANINIALTYSEFLGRAAKTHGSRYIYDENSYKDFTTKMRIECSEHGWFKQKPHSHISMRTGCPKCGILQAAKSNEKGWGSVLNMFKEVHDDRYSYDESTYTDVSSKMKIKCYVHGWFSQKPYQHYSGSGCNKCAIIEVHEKQKIDFKEFKNRSQLKHGSRYNYSEGEYIDIFTPVKISCDKHGVFYQKPRDHYRGSGCPKCQSSRGENSVRLILQRLGIKFKEQKTFEGLKYKSKLKCDFYIPSSKTVIEYNGLQHYEPISVFGGLKGLQETQKRDVIKYDYLAKNNIKLIIVRYDKDDIELYLKEKLNVANNG